MKSREIHDKPRLLGLLLLLWVGLVSAGEPGGTLRGAYVSFPPLTYTDSQGQPAGSIIQLANHIARDAGYRIDWQEMPVRRIHQSLADGSIDLWPTTAGIPALQGLVQETPFPGLNIRLSAFHLEGRPPISDIAQLVGPELLLLRGYTYLGVLDEVLDNDLARFNYLADHTAALSMLVAGRGDYLVAFDTPLDDSLAHQNPGIKLERSLLTEFSVTFAISNRTPDVGQLITQLHHAYNELDGVADSTD